MNVHAVDVGPRNELKLIKPKWIDDMKRVLFSLVLVALSFDTSFAGHKSGSKKNSAPASGPVVINDSNTTYVNNGTINGGSSTGLTVNGQNNKVVNNGTISGSTGVRINGSSAGFTNTGTINGGVRIGGP